jgi:hypothetical protein
VGLGPPGIKEDVVVCVFYSGGPLYILRFEDDEGSKVIWDAYVHRLMKQDKPSEAKAVA